MKKLLYKEQATIASKKGDHKDSINYLRNALNISNDPYEIWNLLGNGIFNLRKLP